VVLRVPSRGFKSRPLCYLSGDYPDLCRPKVRRFLTLSGVDALIQRLGKRIRELRAQRGWSQEQFADVCRVHRTYMGHLERGEKNVSFSSIERVAKALDVSLAELFDGLEAGTSLTLPAANRSGRNKRPEGAGFDLLRAQREVATLERAIATLRSVLHEAHHGPRKPRRKEAALAPKKSQD
jgi:transcriptional regulator with XRE-family HTH domain